MNTNKKNANFSILKQFFIIVLMTYTFLQASFGQDFKPIEPKHKLTWQTLSNDFMGWYTYTYHTIRLSGNFTALDIDSTTIDKSTFLMQLQTGKFFAFKIGTKAREDVYKLYPLQSTNSSIIATQQQLAATAIRNYNMEGLEIPVFDFTDINGKQYNKSNTKGKILVLKCWFIACVACVKEFPELNKLVDSYKNDENVLFISLAIDKQAVLEKFLLKKKFKYTTIPEVGAFMRDSLHITSYPTHLIIDETGKIRKVVNTVEELVPFLKEVLD